MPREIMDAVANQTFNVSIKKIGYYTIYSDLLKEVKENEEWWYHDTFRQNDLKAHRDTLSIPLMGWVEEEGIHYNNQLKTFEYDYFKNVFPHTYFFLKHMELHLKSKLKMAMYVLLPPDKYVRPHIDEGKFYRTHDRYQFMLQGMCNLNVYYDNEVLIPGYVYWLDNDLVHEAYNMGTEDRIVLIFDMLKNKE